MAFHFRQVEIGAGVLTQRRLGIVSRRKTIENPRRDRDHVLRRARQLNADHIRARVDSEPLRGEQRLNAPGDFLIAGSDDGGCRQIARQLRGDVRAAQRGKRAIGCHPRRKHIPDDLRRTQQRIDLEPLGHRDHRHALRNVRLQPLPHAANVLCGDSRDDQRAAVERIPVVGRQLHRRRDLGPFEQPLVLAVLDQPDD